MTAVLSEDDGVTWKGGLRLDDRDSPSYSPDESIHRRFEKLSTYPDGTQTADGKIWITYDLGRYGARRTGNRARSHPRSGCVGRQDRLA